MRILSPLERGAPPRPSSRRGIEAKLDRVERETRFTGVVRAILEVPAGVATERAERILEKSERSCLITSSLRAEVRFEAHVHAAVTV